MAKIKIPADRNQFGGARPYGNVTTIRSVLETALGILVRSTPSRRWPSMMSCRSTRCSRASWSRRCR